jgi:hypothetical protein
VTLHAHTLQNTDFIPFKPLADTLAARGAALDVVRILDFEGASGKIPFKAPKYVLFMDADHQDYRERADGAWAPPPSPELGAGAELERLGAEAEGQPISPFPDTVTEIVCNIACNPTAGCTNLTCSQLSALDLGHRVLSNIIYIFRPVEEDEVPELESESETDAPEAESAAPESHQSAKLVPVTAPKDIDRLQTPRTPPLSRMSSRSSTASSSTSSSSPPSSPASTPALVPFIDNQLSFLPSPDFRIVGCENLRYTADPEMTLFARFASIMNCYADFELGLGLSHLDPPPGYEYLGFDMFAADDLSRAKYFKSYPQWAASCARSSDERAWYDLVTNQ